MVMSEKAALGRLYQRFIGTAAETSHVSEPTMTAEFMYGAPEYTNSKVRISEGAAMRAKIGMVLASQMARRV
jgi:hypothetical protein